MSLNANTHAKGEKTLELQQAERLANELIPATGLPNTTGA